MAALSIHGLVLTGPIKPRAELSPSGASHLVFGPTDTGKSYIEACISYCLGSDDKPLDVGLSEGYTHAALHVRVTDGSDFTFFRDLIAGNSAVYAGFHRSPPTAQHPLADQIDTLLIQWSGAAGRRILVKSGVLGNVAASDLRRLSLFDEIRTLDRVPFEGKDHLFKMRNRAVAALVLTGNDDSGVILAVKTDDRNIAKGHVQALEEELRSLQATIPDAWTHRDCVEGMALIEGEIERISSFIRANADELSQLKSQHQELDTQLRSMQIELIDARETKERFMLLADKYENDLNRLNALIKASEITETFEIRPCPLCKSDITHQLSHKGPDGNLIQRAAEAEVAKINSLKLGLTIAIDDLDGDIDVLRADIADVERKVADNVRTQTLLIRPATPSLEADYLERLTERRTEMTMALRSIERMQAISQRLMEMTARAKRAKQAINRDFSGSAEDLCRRISALLSDWTVPMVGTVQFDEDHADIYINHRKRVSYGKGKRGIFLTAMVVAIMERALELGHPHLGFIVIDSPVVTYKDPKHGCSDPDEALDTSVKDNFYAWLADRKSPGQIIVLENEEPTPEVQARLSHTEFVGSGRAAGRRGFFPV